MNFVTAPLIADLFLLAILAIGREEVHDGTIGADNIAPLDIMGFFITLAYIAISLDASGLIRYLAFKVLQKGGKAGHRLFFYLYAFFFVLGTFIGNDPIILSGTAFLAYMTRVSNNIIHPRAWIHTQFTIANIASAILVSSNPTNLVLAGAFNISFIKYTANMIVPVVATAVILFPILLYIIFADRSLIPLSITIHELSDEAKAKKPVNPNIPNARGASDEDAGIFVAAGDDGDDKEANERKQLSLEEIMNPFLDTRGAGFGAALMAVTLVTLLVLNAVDQRNGGQPHPVFWVTLPAAVVMFLWDVFFGWTNRHETREIAQRGRMELESARAEYARLKIEREREALRAEPERMTPTFDTSPAWPASPEWTNALGLSATENDDADKRSRELYTPDPTTKGPSPVPGVYLESLPAQADLCSPVEMRQAAEFSRMTPVNDGENADDRLAEGADKATHLESTRGRASVVERESSHSLDQNIDLKKAVSDKRGPDIALPGEHQTLRTPMTLVSLTAKAYRWLQETFPTVMAVVAHLPFALVPFALSMFVLVQALVTKGWVQVFAYGWDHWVNKTGACLFIAATLHERFRVLNRY
jgi:Na+/H+ antiporter NhaD/arsenite permease-like protein